MPIIDTFAQMYGKPVDTPDLGAAYKTGMESYKMGADVQQKGIALAQQQEEIGIKRLEADQNKQILQMKKDQYIAQKLDDVLGTLDEKAFKFKIKNLQKVASTLGVTVPDEAMERLTALPEERKVIQDRIKKVDWRNPKEVLALKSAISAFFGGANEPANQFFKEYDDMITKRDVASENRALRAAQLEETRRYHNIVAGATEKRLELAADRNKRLWASQDLTVQKTKDAAQDKILSDPTLANYTLQTQAYEKALQTLSNPRMNWQEFKETNADLAQLMVAKMSAVVPLAREAGIDQKTLARDIQLAKNYLSGEIEGDVPPAMRGRVLESFNRIKKVVDYMSTKRIHALVDSRYRLGTFEREEADAIYRTAHEQMGRPSAMYVPSKERTTEGISRYSPTTKQIAAEYSAMPSPSPVPQQPSGTSEEASAVAKIEAETDPEKKKNMMQWFAYKFRKPYARR